MEQNLEQNLMQNLDGCCVNKDLPIVERVCLYDSNGNITKESINYTPPNIARESLNTEYEIMQMDNRLANQHLMNEQFKLQNERMMMQMNYDFAMNAMMTERMKCMAFIEAIKGKIDSLESITQNHQHVLDNRTNQQLQLENKSNVVEEEAEDLVYNPKQDYYETVNKGETMNIEKPDFIEFTNKSVSINTSNTQESTPVNVDKQNNCYSCDTTEMYYVTKVKRTIIEGHSLNLSEDLLSTPKVKYDQKITLNIFEDITNDLNNCNFQVCKKFSVYKHMINPICNKNTKYTYWEAFDIQYVENWKEYCSKYLCGLTNAPVLIIRLFEKLNSGRMGYHVHMIANSNTFTCEFYNKREEALPKFKEINNQYKENKIDKETKCLKIQELLNSISKIYYEDDSSESECSNDKEGATLIDDNYVLFVRALKYAFWLNNDAKFDIIESICQTDNQYDTTYYLTTTEPIGQDVKRWNMFKHPNVDGVMSIEKPHCFTCEKCDDGKRYTISTKLNYLNSKTKKKK